VFEQKEIFKDPGKLHWKCNLTGLSSVYTVKKDSQHSTSGKEEKKWIKRNLRK
jgi:hypothetical protein